MLRGVNRQQIFFDVEDYHSFKHILSHYKSVCNFQLFAYCLMGNHVHLLIKTETEPLEKVMKRLETAFVYWYNMKYQRTGPLFQGRYRSEIIESDTVFMIVLRYILMNPVKAGLCRFPEEYPYSSGAEYLLSKRGITDTATVFEMTDLSSFNSFVQTENSDRCIDIDNTPSKKCTDTEAKKLIIEEFGTFFPKTGKPKERHLFYHSVRKLLNAGISIRQLSRLTGISKHIIEKANE